MANDLRWGVEGRVRDRIRNLAITTDWTAAQVRREAVQEFGDAAVPGERAVQKAVKGWRATPPDETDEPWIFGKDPDDDRILLPLLRLGRGAPRRRHAERLLWMFRACPSLDDLELAWFLSRLLERLAAEPEDPRRSAITDVLTVLAYRPWEDEGRDFADAVAAGRVPFGIAHMIELDAAVAAAKLRLLQGDRA